jgi:VWFA-related protein
VTIARRAVALTLWLAALALAAPVARPAARQATPFRAGVGWVVLHVSVKDGHGDLVTTLERDAFSVYENGRLQPITLFSRDDVPVSLGLVLDNSGSMRRVRPSVEAAALALVRASNPQDEMFVLNFADKPRLDVPLTTDLAVIEAGIARADAIGGTALRDAVDEAATYLGEHGSRDRKALVLVSDGRDNASLANLAQAQHAAEDRQITLYAIALSGQTDEAETDSGRNDLEDLVKPTGGVVTCPSAPRDVEPAAEALARQIRSQYTIAYAPLNQALDRSYRAIRVQARAPERLTVTTRAGYWATPR